MSLESILNEIQTNPNAATSPSGYDNSPLPAGVYDFVIVKGEEAKYAGGVKSMKDSDIAAYLSLPGNEEILCGKKMILHAKVENGEYKDRLVKWYFVLILASDAKPASTGKSAEQMYEYDKQKIRGLVDRLNAFKKHDFKTPNDFEGHVVRLRVTVSGKYNNYDFIVKKDEKIEKPGVVTSTAPVRDTDEAPF